ncbi:reverse transcriptase domain-containing protein [Enterobacter hormaechei]|uniref:reverse transcriptase domain-containing protein n=1 Tax=Enterobacter hormaechei TaxID=158836 RepID=UPI0023E44EFC|nr:reverse transcriptase domain-containing protein [Enterobacter hormaechei]
MYIKVGEGKDIIVSKISVDDIVFGGKEVLCKGFADKMKHEFEMSMFGEIKFFVGLQVHQLKHGIFVTQSKYIKEILKTFGLEESKLVSTPMATGNKLSKNDELAEVNQTMYRSIGPCTKMLSGKIR